MGSSVDAAVLARPRRATGVWSRHAVRPVDAFVLALVLLVGAITLSEQMKLMGESRLPTLDEASHGMRGVLLADRLRGGDPLDFVRTVSAFSPWPPFFALLEAPVFLLFGYEYHVGRILMMVLFFLTLLAAYLVGREVDPVFGPVVGAVASGLVAASPMFFFHGLYVMLEVPSALLTLLVSLFYIRYLRTGGRRSLNACWAAGTCLFFCKYNYGALALTSVWGSEFWRDRVLRSSVRERVAAYFRSGMFKSPFHLFLSFYLLFIGWIFFTGGRVIYPFGHRISVRSAGNPTFLLIVILLIRFLVEVGRRRKTLRSTFRRLDPRVRSFILAFALPVVVWFLHPHHVKDAFNFIENRNPGVRVWDTESLMFYPRRFFGIYSPGAVVGGVTALAALTAPLLRRGKGDVSRFLVLATTVMVLSPVLHPLKRDRFFFIAPLFIWLLAGLSLGSLLGLASRRLPLFVRGPAIGLASAGVLTLLLALGWNREASAKEYLKWTEPPELRPLLDEIAGTAGRSAGSVWLGEYGSVGRALVEWHCRLREPRIHADCLPRAVSTRTAESDPEALLDSVHSLPGVERVLVLSWESGGSDPEYLGYNRCLPAVEAALSRDPRFEKEREISFRETAHRLAVYRKRLVSLKRIPSGLESLSATGIRDAVRPRICGRESASAAFGGASGGRKGVFGHSQHVNWPLQVIRLPCLLSIIEAGSLGYASIRVYRW